ncbi:hypothetical protein M9Y10_035370 [Tritrichomonas musculus]|uniref:Uncharacterized protein n=1 Tax=Tritrichomonas musculus TaxID=1915356 RepID=A0ABR2KIB9_9EUKA
MHLNQQTEDDQSMHLNQQTEDDQSMHLNQQPGQNNQNKMQILQQVMSLLQPTPPDPNILYDDFSSIPFFLNRMYENTTVFFYIEKIITRRSLNQDQGYFYEFIVSDSYGSQEHLEIYDRSGAITSDQLTILGRKSSFISEKVTNYEYKGNIQMTINVNQSSDKYVRYPTYEELQEVGVITKFKYITDNELYNIPVSVVVAVTSHGSIKTAANGILYMAIRIIDEDSNKMTAIVLKEEIISYLTTKCKSESMPILFRNAIFKVFKGKVMM